MNGQSAARVEGARVPLRDDELVWGFAKPHRIGTVCGLRCQQCHVPGKEQRTLDVHGTLLPPDTPFFILAEATEEDWSRIVRHRGGGRPFHPPEIRYFYFVRSD